MGLLKDALGGFVWKGDPGEPSTGDPRVSVTEQEGELLTFLARGKWVIEIGTGLGVSTRALAQSAEMVRTFDVDPWVQETVWPDLDAMAHVYTHSYRPDPARNQFGPFDLAFIDGDHTPSALAEDLRYCSELVKHGMIVVHDSRAEHVRDTLFEAPWDWTFIPTTHGMAVAFIGWVA